MDSSSENRFISLKIKSRLENLLLVRLAVAAILSHAIPDEKDVYQIELCLIEALNNIIIHAYQSKQDQDIRIGVSLGPGSIRFTLTDNGLSADSLEEKALHIDTGDLKRLPEGGMGLHIIHTVMDEVIYKPGTPENALTLVKYFKTP